MQDPVPRGLLVKFNMIFASLSFCFLILNLAQFPKHNATDKAVSVSTDNIFSRQKVFIWKNKVLFWHKPFWGGKTFFRASDCEFKSVPVSNYARWPFISVVNKACLSLLRYKECSLYQRTENFPAATSSAICHQAYQIFEALFVLKII